MMDKIIFSSEIYSYLKDELVAISGYCAGEIHSKKFPDGEVYHRILTEVSEKDVVLIGGTIDDMNTLEVYDLAQGLMHAGAKSLSIIIPYFGYATMERAVLSGEIVKAKNRALLFSSIPTCAESNKVYLMDLHSEGIPYYFDRDIRTEHIYCKDLIMSAAREIGGTDFVLAATDAGRAKWVESLANEMHVKSAFVYKQRISGNETQVTGVNAEVKNKIVIIYDDMIRTGGSLMKAAEVYQQEGAKEVYAITTHGLFVGDALKKIAAQGIIQQVVSCDTHPRALQENNPILKIKSVAALIFEALKPT